MKFCGPSHVLYAWLLGLALLVQGQSLEELIAETPPCALPCFLETVPTSGCVVVDVPSLNSCLCNNNTLLTSVTACARLRCPVNPDQVQAAALLDVVCPNQALVVESQATLLRAVAIVAIALAVPSISLRWYARYQLSKLGWDDYAALGAAVFLIAIAVCQLANVNFEFGRHVWNVDPRNAIPQLQLYWVSQQLYVIDQFFVKASMLALYARVFTDRSFHRTVIGCIVFLTIQDIAFFLVVMLRCMPIGAIWDTRTPGKCLNLNTIGLCGAYMGIVEHVVILLLPLRELWKLKLSIKKRLQLALVFSIGSFSCITSVIRIRYIATFDPAADISWVTVQVVIWSMVEDLSAVIYINLPPCRALIGRLSPRRFQTGANRATTTYTSFGNAYAPPRRATLHSEREGLSTKSSSVGRHAASPWRGSTVTTVTTRGRGFDEKRVLEDIERLKDADTSWGPLVQTDVTVHEEDSPILILQKPDTAHPAATTRSRLPVTIDESDLGILGTLRDQEWDHARQGLGFSGRGAHAHKH